MRPPRGMAAAPDVRHLIGRRASYPAARS
jgi:hypothetical protein